MKPQTSCIEEEARCVESQCFFFFFRNQPIAFFETSRSSKLGYLIAGAHGDDPIYHDISVIHIIT